MSGLILAGSAEFKTKLSSSDLFDPRLQAVVEKIVDVSYGGENGHTNGQQSRADEEMRNKERRTRLQMSSDDTIENTNSLW